MSFWPGVVRTENMIELLDGNGWRKKTGLNTPSLFIESPTFVGRVLAALYNNEQEKKYNSGKVVVVAEAAKKYGVKDINGFTPPSIRSLKFLIPSLILAQFTPDEIPSGLEENLIRFTPDWLLPMSFMEGGSPNQKSATLN